MAIFTNGDDKQSPFAGFSGKIVALLGIFFVIGVVLVFFGLMGYAEGNGL
jgi:hypothetical protein